MPDWCVDILASIVGQLLGFDAREVRDHLMAPRLASNRALAELIRGKTVRVNSGNIGELSAQTRGFVHGARKLVSVRRQFSMHHLTEEVVVPQIELQRDVFGYGDDLLQAKKAAARQRIERFLDHYDPGKTEENIVGLLGNGYDDLVNCRGPYQRVPWTDAHDAIREFAENVVKDRRVQFRLVRERHLSPDLARWTRTFANATAMDDAVIVKVCHCGAWTILHRTGNADADGVFHHELGNLYRTVECYEHGADVASVLRLLGDAAVSLERRRDQVRADGLQELQESNPEPVSKPRPPVRVWLPRN